MTHTLVLAAHVVAGTVGLLLGPAAMLRDTRRFAAGRRGCSRSSDAYHAVVLAVCVSAVALVVLYRPELWWLTIVSLLTCGLAVLARRSAAGRHRLWAHGYAHGQGGSYIALVTALVVVALTVDGPVRGAAVLLPWLLPTVVGTVSIEAWRRRLDRVVPVVPTTASQAVAAS